MMQASAPAPAPAPYQQPTIAVAAAAAIRIQSKFRQKNAKRFVLAIPKRQLFHEDLRKCQPLIHAIQGCEHLFDLSNARVLVFEMLALCEHIGGFVGRTRSRLPISSLMSSGKRIFYCPRICKVLEGFMGHDLTIFSAPFGCDESHLHPGEPLATSPDPLPSAQVQTMRAEAKKIKNQRGRKKNRQAQADPLQFMPKMLTERIARLLHVAGGKRAAGWRQQAGGWRPRRFNNREKRLFAKLLKHTVVSIQKMVRIKQKKRFEQIAVPAIVRIQMAVRIRQAKRRVWTRKLRCQVLAR